LTTVRRVQSSTPRGAGEPVDSLVLPNARYVVIMQVTLEP
jgi:hypothetical protein